MSEVLIFESKNSKIIRNDNSEWGVPVVTKMLNQEYPSPKSIRHFYNEYEITKGLEVPGVRKVLRMGKIQNRHALVFEYAPGTPVKKLVADSPMPIGAFLRIAVEVARILGDIHKLNIIHKDVNSQNIVFDEATQTVTLLDFGISTQLDLKEQHLGNPERLEGSLNYISPEQTGRMNRVVDYRTDLYSLGVTFFEMLTGRLPFQRKDAMELVHAHLAQKPQLVHNLRPEIPQVLCDMVERLLAKNAEHRYQSAYGLKHDLQHCLDSWKERGVIEMFPLGEKDFSGKFQITQKLYGRDDEMHVVMEAFERIARGGLETVLVGGYSGTGKSALVHETHRPITERRGYFIEGKFDQFQRSVPYFAFIEAFRGFVSLLLTENEERLQPLTVAIQRAVGSEGKVLTDVLPSLELLIGPQPDVPEVGGAEGQNRFNYIFRRFVQAICGPDHPIVLFIDDLQWADAASLSLLQVLMTDTNTRFLLCVCAFRNNEVSAGHPCITTVHEMKKKGAYVSRLDIGNLSLTDVHLLISDATSLPPERTETLAKLVFAKTHGNAFFVTQFLKSLAHERLLQFDFTRYQWSWDVEQIRARNITDNVVELLAGKVASLPDDTQQILKVAASVGSQFDLDTLAVCCGSLFNVEALSAVGGTTNDAVLKALHAALAEGLLTPSEDRYRFVHDRIQQAVYSLIPAAERVRLHLRIGELLLEKTPVDQQENNLFDIVNQYNQGLELVTTPEKRDLLAELNLRAGRKAKLSSAFKPAGEYLETGIGLLRPDHWQSQYELSLNLFTEAAETAYNMGEFEPMAQKIDAVLQNSRDLLDTIRPYAIRINAYKAQNKLQESIDTGLEVLARLGETFPKKGALPLVMADLLKTKFQLRGKDLQTLTNLPAMQNPHKEAAMRMLNDIASPAYWARPGILPFLIFRMVQLSLKYGNTSISAFGFATYGLLMCGVVGDMKEGYKFGQLGLALLDRFKAKEWLSQVYTPVYALINHWSEHVHKSLEPFLYSYRVGFETGAIEYACININIYCNHLYLGGKPLVKAEEEMRAFSRTMAEYKQETNLNYNEAYRQAVLNLLGRSEDPTRLIGEAYDEEKMAVQNQERQDRAGTFLIHFHGMILNYLFQNFEVALKHAQNTRPLLDAVLAKYDVPVFWFYEALVSMAVARERSGITRSKLLNRAAKNIVQFRKWAKFCPENHTHKLELLLAEQAYSRGKNETARLHFDRAIAGASVQEFLNEEALANERAGVFYLRTGQESIAEHFLKKSFQTYREWGASAKLDDMRQRYPQSLSGMPKEKSSVSLNTTNIDTTNMGMESTLDLDTVMKAAQAISGEIVFSRLLHTLLDIAIENAGAEQGCLVMEENGQWMIQAAETNDTKGAVGATPLSGNPLVPESVVQYVVRTRESLVLDNMQQDDRFAADPVVKTRQLRSVLCMPVMNKGNLSGILYLENNLQGGVFTESRVHFLRLLSGQIAISIENALLYENLEQKVAQRTEQIARQKDQIELEKQKSDNLLLNILPTETADELKRLGRAKPRNYESVTVLFTDFVNFSQAAERLSAEDLVEEIHKYYSAFDAILSKHNLEKIKTIGDSYMCAGGLPAENHTHALDAVNAALEMHEFIGQESVERLRAGLPAFNCRIGIHTGPVVAGIVGTKKFAYDIWGSTVNIASRMESSGAAGKVNISEATYELVKDHFQCSHRGKIEAKNAGLVDMYFVEKR
ncbi:MAG: AAA family ATPase [Saprospiraceae bacterium]|nr:AAA family ATPase [Saprospiraceae bacterium]